MHSSQRPLCYCFWQARAKLLVAAARFYLGVKAIIPLAFLPICAVELWDGFAFGRAFVAPADAFVPRYYFVENLEGMVFTDYLRLNWLSCTVYEAWVSEAGQPAAANGFLERTLLTEVCR